MKQTQEDSFLIAPAKLIKMRVKKSNNRTGGNIIKSVGTENYMVKDTPCLIPKENMGFFTNMQKQSQHSSFGDFPNPFNAFWKRPKN